MEGRSPDIFVAEWLQGQGGALALTSETPCIPTINYHPIARGIEPDMNEGEGYCGKAAPERRGEGWNRLAATMPGSPSTT